MKKALYPGTFDPFTKGHEYIVEQSLKNFDFVEILITQNPNKKTMFSIKERLQMVQSLYKDNPKIKVATSEGNFTANYAESYNYYFLIRGIRDDKDFEYEKTIEKINQQINPSLSHFLIKSNQETNQISSSLVKSLLPFYGWELLVDNYVDNNIKKMISIKLYEENFSKIWYNIAGESAITRKWLKIIMNEYSSPLRYYHNMQHILKMLNNLEEYSKIYEISNMEKNILSYAIVFHDIIYDSKKDNNEEESLLLFEDFSNEIGFFSHVNHKVKELIMATKNHDKNKGDDEAINLFLDLDLAILGAEKVVFDVYEKQIRKEYEWVPENVFFEKRHQIMKNFVNCYKTDWAKKKYGNYLRLNIEDKYEKK